MIIEHGPPGSRGVTQLQYVGSDGTDGESSRLQTMARVAGALSLGAALYGFAKNDRELKRIGGAGALAALGIELLG